MGSLVTWKPELSPAVQNLLALHGLTYRETMYSISPGTRDWIWNIYRSNDAKKIGQLPISASLETWQIFIAEMHTIWPA